MHPILFEIPKIDLGNWTIGPIPIRLYGLMIGMGFLIGIWLASRQAKKEGISPDRILDMGVYLLLAAIIGSRLFYVLVNIGEFQRNWLDVFAIWKGGLVFYGGLIGAVAAGVWYVRRYDLPVWKTADILAPYIALGHVFGRFGCFFAGCCYGAPCHSPVGIIFSDPHSLAPLGISLYPTQLFEAGGEFVPVETETGGDKTIFVPLDAVTIGTGNQFLFILDGNKARRVDVIPGEINGSLIEIKDGLNGDEQVIVGGAREVMDGQTVTIN